MLLGKAFSTIRVFAACSWQSSAKLLGHNPARACDLESTLLVLRMRDSVPAAERLAGRMLDTGD